MVSAGGASVDAGTARTGAGAGAAAAIARVISLRGASVHAGSTALLHATDLEIGVVERTVVLGPNGSGKTTLLRAIHGLAALSRETPRSPRAAGSRAAPTCSRNR